MTLPDSATASPVDLLTGAETLLRTVALQANTIHLQAQTIADLTAQLAAMSDFDDQAPGRQPRYLDGSNDD